MPYTIVGYDAVEDFDRVETSSGREYRSEGGSVLWVGPDGAARYTQFLGSDITAAGVYYKPAPYEYSGQCESAERS